MFRAIVIAALLAVIVTLAVPAPFTSVGYGVAIAAGLAGWGSKHQ